MLSICIPTYNRAELLRSCLHSIVRQSSQFQDKVEVIVSDNCSPDHTREAVEWAGQYGPIHYARNAENIGACSNFIHAAKVLAQGEYCWLMGDDDVLRDGAIEAVITALETHPQIDYVFVNSSHAHTSERGQGIVNPVHYPEWVGNPCCRREDCLVPRWEHIIKFAQQSNLFTFIGNSILRTELWRDSPVQPGSDEGFPSLETTFPHSCTFAHQAVGKPAFYIGYPYVQGFIDGRGINGNWPMIVLVRGLEFSDLLAHLGAQRAMVSRYRNLQLEASVGAFWTLLIDRSTPGRSYFKPYKLCQKYWMYLGFYKMLFMYPLNCYIRPLFKPFNEFAK